MNSRSSRAGRGGRVSPDEPVYVISVAADLVGVHPQTLRGYERAGLVVPARTPGGTRRYSDNDIAKLRRIQDLTDQGVPHVGVARILELERQLAELRRPSTALVPASRASSQHPPSHHGTTQQRRARARR